MNKYKNHSLSLLTCLFLILAGTYACQKNEVESIPAVPAQAPAGITDLMTSLNMYYFKEPVKAPEFELFSLTGKKVNISQYHGKTILLSFWTTW